MQSNDADIRFPIGMKMPSEVCYLCSFPLRSSTTSPFPLHCHKVTVHRGPKLSSVWPRPVRSAQETHETFSRESAHKLALFRFPAYSCITQYFLPTMKPQAYKGPYSRARRTEDGFSLASPYVNHNSMIIPFGRYTNLWNRNYNIDVV